MIDFNNIMKNEKVKRTPKKIFSFIGSLIFGAGLVVLFYVVYILAYACMN